MVDNGRIEPTWEVVLRMEGRDVAIAASIETKPGRYDVVVAVDAPGSILAYADVIREASFRIATSSGFIPVDDGEADDLERA